MRSGIVLGLLWLSLPGKLWANEPSSGSRKPKIIFIYPSQGDPRWREHYRDLPSPRNLDAAFLSTIDERIGLLMKKVDDAGLCEQTIVVFQSDHGHSLEERAHCGGGSAWPYRGAKFRLFQGGIRVPAVISWPDKLSQGEVRAQ